MSVAIGLLIGSILGLTGAGGSIFAVPLLVLLLGLAPSEAMGTALGAVAVGAAIGAIAQRTQVLRLPALLIALCGSLAAPFGKYLSTIVSDTLLVIGFSVIAITIAARMLSQALSKPTLTTYVRASVPESHEVSQAMACRFSATGQFQLKPRCIAGLVIGGSFIGFASGLFGVGGGFLIVPLLIFLSSLPMPRAVATSLATITIISGSGFVAHLAISGFENTERLMPIFLGAVAGMLMSQQFSKKLAGPKLQIIFSVLLIFVVLILLVQHL